MKSFSDSNALERITQLLDPGSFVEWMGEEHHLHSPQLHRLNLNTSPNDGVIIGKGKLNGWDVYVASEDGNFLGGSVGEVHGAKITGLLRLAVRDKPKVVLLLLETGGVRLQEANAGMISVSEIMRAVLQARENGIAVIALIGGLHGCFGGMSLVSGCTNAIIMSEHSFLSLTGPKALNTENVQRETINELMSGEHRFQMGDCDLLLPDQIEAFREGTIKIIQQVIDQGTSLTFSDLESEQNKLSERIK
jgi:malonate decarboxylase beta subunit